MTCYGCGRDLASTDEVSCSVCWTCEGCTPAHGNCLDCRDMRAEDIADRFRRAVLEVPMWRDGL
jgi:hypothetical protein